MGILRWPPSEFWAATPLDLTAAIEGYLESRGVDVEERTASAKITNDDLRELMQNEPFETHSITRREKG